MFTPQIVKPATSTDVAHAAGVSRATVSLVLNNRESARIPEDTRVRVREAARHLGYVPNNAARALKTSVTDGWVCASDPSEAETAFARAIDLVVGEIADNGEDVYRDIDSTTVGADAASSWARIRPSGVLASAHRCTAEGTEMLRSAGVRTLLVYGPEQLSHAPTIVLPQREYGAFAAEHLRGQGHERILCVMPATAHLEGDVRERLAGVRAGAGDGTLVSVIHTEPAGTALRDWARGWTYDPTPPSAVVAYDDRYARAVIRALHDAGLRCPEDVAVLGAEGMSFGADHVPSISSIAFSPTVMAGRITAAIQALASGERVERVDAPPLQLIERESTRLFAP